MLDNKFKKQDEDKENNFCLIEEEF